LKSINYIYRISKSHKSLTGFENPIIGFQNLLLSKPDLENQYYLNWISKSSIYVWGGASQKIKNHLSYFGKICGNRRKVEGARRNLQINMFLERLRLVCVTRRH